MSVLHKQIFALLTGQGAGELFAGQQDLLAGDAIATLNGLANGHVYPLVAPKGTPTPYVVYGVPTSTSDSTFCGAGPHAHSVDINCWAPSLELALEMRDAAIAALSGLAEGEYTEFEGYDQDTGDFNAGVELRVWL